MERYQELKKLIKYSKGAISSNVLVKSNNLEVTLFCMAEGTEISEHTSTRQGLVYVLDGVGIFHLNKKFIPMHPGVLIHMEKDASHSLKATQNTSFLLTLTK